MNDQDTRHPTSVAAAPPTEEQVQPLIEQAACWLIAVLERHGVLDDTQTDPLADQAPLLAGFNAASIQGRAATGERAGRRLRGRLRASEPAPSASPPTQCSRRMG